MMLVNLQEYAVILIHNCVCGLYDVLICYVDEDFGGEGLNIIVIYFLQNEVGGGSRICITFLLHICDCFQTFFRLLFDFDCVLFWGGVVLAILWFVGVVSKLL